MPLGVIAIIYESRPNVTADAFGLTLKSGNAVILRGGSDAIHSNTAIVSVITESLKECGINPDAIQLVTDTDRALVTELMHMNKYIDVIIPRGGAGLIQNPDDVALYVKDIVILCPVIVKPVFARFFIV